MTDYSSWLEIRLGRWMGVPVRIHGLLSLYLILTLLTSALSTDDHVGQTAGWLALLIVAVGLHELGHALMAIWLGGEPDEVRLWPLGNLVGPSPVPPSRWAETAWTAAAGPLTSLGLALAMAVSLLVADAPMVWNPFGHQGSGTPILAGGKPAAPFEAIWWIGWFGYLNWILFLINLIPAPPLDGGRILRACLTRPALIQRDSMIAPHTAWAMAALLLLAGLARLIFATHKEGALTLILLAALIYMMVRYEAHLMEDGGYLDDGLFGYDFSEGYTSLEGNAQKVRPYRGESALKRWRRRRSDLRRQRRRARETAEEERMDEILAKLHTQGRASLTDEEQRFLVRVSAKYRNRPKARG